MSRRNSTLRRLCLVTHFVLTFRVTMANMAPIIRATQDTLEAAQLEAAQRSLASAAVNLSSLPPWESSTYGGHLEAAIASLHQAEADAGIARQGGPIADLHQAVADARPARGAGQSPTAGNQPPAMHETAVPRLPQVAFNAPRTPLVEAVEEMNDALATLVRNVPVTGDRITIDGLQAKILADLGRAGAELSAGVDFHNNQDRTPAAPLAESAPEASLIQTAIAATALSIGLALAGLYWFSRIKTRSRHPVPTDPQPRG